MDETSLSVEEFHEIYMDAIEGPALAQTTAAVQPKAVFFGGQPGAGKSTLARSARKFFGSDNFITVDIDQLRTLHPQYLPMVVKPETESLAPSAVQSVCSQWAARLRDVSVMHGRNVLLDGTMSNPGQVRAAAFAMRKAGYSIEAHILAVHEESSAVSLRQRFENEKLILGFGRHMPPDFHAVAAKGIVDTIDTIESEELVDLLVVHDREGHVVYRNRIVEGTWEREPDGANVMRSFRAKLYSAVEKQNIADQWSEVLDKMARRSASAHEMQEAQVAHARASAIALSARSGIDEEFDGRITSVDLAAGTVTQKIGRDPATVTLHSTNKLSRLPDAGEIVSIKYRDGVGQVSDRKIERALGR